MTIIKHLDYSELSIQVDDYPIKQEGVYGLYARSPTVFYPRDEESLNRGVLNTFFIDKLARVIKPTSIFDIRIFYRGKLISYKNLPLKNAALEVFLNMIRMDYSGTRYQERVLDNPEAVRA